MTLSLTALEKGSGIFRIFWPKRGVAKCPLNTPMEMSESSDDIDGGGALTV